MNQHSCSELGSVQLLLPARGAQTTAATPSNLAVETVMCDKQWHVLHDEPSRLHPRFMLASFAKVQLH